MGELKILNSTHCAQGRSCASFGEIIQGRKSNGTDFLVNIPINLWSVCNIDAVPKNGPLIVNCSYEKSKRVAELAIRKMGMAEGYEINVSLSRNIPIGKGLSSSTADMLATIRGLESYFNFSFAPNVISEIFHQIEPHEGLMYEMSVIYNHRKGKLLKDLRHIPKFKIIYLDFGGVVDSIDYNQNLSFSNAITKQYDLLYYKCIKAYTHKDDEMIAECAVRSLSLSLEIKDDHSRSLAFDNFKNFEAMGVINTHSGTCVGFVYPKEFNDERLKEIASTISNFYGLSVYLTSSL